jgi:hypothetical protein
VKTEEVYNRPSIILRWGCSLLVMLRLRVLLVVKQTTLMCLFRRIFKGFTKTLRLWSIVQYEMYKDGLNKVFIERL